MAMTELLISPAEGMARLPSGFFDKTIRLRANRLSDISPITNCKDLFHIEAPNNKIEEIQPLSELKSLNHLDLSFNHIYEARICKLKYLEFLNLSHNYIEYIDVIF